MARVHDLVVHRQTIGELAAYANPFERILIYPIAIVIKLLRLPIRDVSCDDPPVDHLAELAICPNELPSHARARMAADAERLERLGFQPSFGYAMLLPNMQTELFHLYLRRADGQVVARITYRHWIPQGKHRLFTQYLSTDRSGATVITTNGPLDCLQPPEVYVERKIDEPIADLLLRHEEVVRNRQLSPLRLADDGSIRRVVEALHDQFREFQLHRRTYAPLHDDSPTAVRLVNPASRPPNSKTAESKPAALKTMDPWPLAAPPAPLSPVTDDEEPELDVEPESPHDAMTDEVVRLMVQETTKKSSSAGNILLLLVSLGAFILVSKGQDDWSWTWLLVPALLVHELGHLIAMRACGYHNTKIFFIPFFGAAASGINHNVPGWKRVLVSLAGPIPGLAFGILSGSAGLVYSQPLLTRFGVISCLLNVFNLIPVMPLDGGWVGFHLLFCRHPLLDAAFRASGAFALFLVAIVGRQIPLGVLGGLMLMGAFRAFKIGDVARRLRREGVELAAEDSPELEIGLATRAADGIRRAYMNMPKLSTKVLAAAALEVYTLIQARPPGILASLFFGSLQAGGFLVGLVAAIVFVAGDKENLGQLLHAAARQPAHEYRCGTSAEWSGQEATFRPAETVQIVALCDSPVTAQQQFDSLQKELSATDRVTLVGPYLFLTLRADDDAARERAIQRLTDANITVHVLSEEMRLSSLRITALARTSEEAASITQELETFSRLGALADLLPPWSARWRMGGEEIERYRQARQTFFTLEQVRRGPSDADQDKLKQWQKESQKARRFGRKEEARELEERIRRLGEEAHLTALERQLADARNDADRECIQLYLTWQKETQEHWRTQRNKGDRGGDETDGFDFHTLEPYRELQTRLGKIDADDFDSIRVSAKSLVAHQTGLVVEINWIQLVNDGDGLRALLEWLCERHCATIKFEEDTTALFNRWED